ncbi:MAG: hypothetical protein ABI168_09155 [Ginsengibacter sp.]
MKKHIYTSILIFFVASFMTANAQTYRDTMPFTIQADLKLQNLNKSYVNTGILYDRVFPIANIDERKGYPSTNTDTSHPDHFMQAYFEIYNSAYNKTGWDKPEDLDKYLDTMQADAHPIGVLFYKFNTVETNALQDHLLDTLSNGQFVDVSGRPRSPYFNDTTFIASPVLSENEVIVEGENTFYMDPKFFLHNEYLQITQIRVDFGDSQGE